MIQILIKNKSEPILLIAFFVLLMPKISLGVEGDLIWSQISNPSDTADTAEGIIVDGSAIYIAEIFKNYCFMKNT